MSLQWTAVATFLYAEVFAVLLLCIPFISPRSLFTEDPLSPPRSVRQQHRGTFWPVWFSVGVRRRRGRLDGRAFQRRTQSGWQKIFKSRLVQLVLTYGNTFFVVLIVILVLLLIDALREIKKYDVSENVDLKNNPVAVEHIHMKLFRAQRNLYIAGFALLLSFLLRRLVTLISQQATLLASNEAFKKQAEGASDAAKKYLEENEKLKKELKEAGIDVGDLNLKETDHVADNKKLKVEVQKLKEELESTKKTLQKSENEVHAIKKQSEGLSKEYDRLLDEHSKLQAVVDGPKDKKEE